MKVIELNSGCIILISPKIVYICGILSGTPSLARAVAIFPFIIIRSEKDMEPWLINHERIHLKQQIEMFFVGLVVLNILETIYSVIFLKKSFAKAYRWRASEQEAYRNQNNLSYLKDRKVWAMFNYLKDKKEFHFGKPGEVILML